MTATKISACVDCATPIIGTHFRCPVCHDKHAANLPSSDEDVTVPRRRLAKSPSVEALFVWISSSLLTAIAIAALMLTAGKSCQ